MTQTNFCFQLLVVWLSPYGLCIFSPNLVQISSQNLEMSTLSKIRDGRSLQHGFLS